MVRLQWHGALLARATTMAAGSHFLSAVLATVSGCVAAMYFFPRFRALSKCGDRCAISLRAARVGAARGCVAINLARTV